MSSNSSELKKFEDEITKKKLEIKKLELEQLNIELQKKVDETNRKRSVYEKEAKARHDKYIVNSMEEEEYEAYFASRNEREKNKKQKNYYYDSDHDI